MVDLAKFAEENKIIIGACPPEPICTKRLGASLFVPFVSKNITKRTDPAAVFPEVESIFVVGVKGMSIRSEAASMKQPQIRHVSLSSLGTDIDYHLRVKDVLLKLTNALEHSLSAQDGFNFKSKILIDSPTLDERALAYRAGLGFFGRNGLITSPEFGSRFNIGLLLTNIDWGVVNGFVQQLPKALLSSCPTDCKLCMQACPTGAIVEGSSLNTSRCASYLTQKKELSPDEEALMGSLLYGCDTCQDVCPLNSPREKTYVNPQDLIDATDEEIKSKFAHTAMLWQGVDILRRNARIAAQGPNNLTNPNFFV